MVIRDYATMMIVVLLKAVCCRNCTELSCQNNYLQKMMYM